MDILFLGGCGSPFEVYLNWFTFVGLHSNDTRVDMVIFDVVKMEFACHGRILGRECSKDSSISLKEWPGLDGADEKRLGAKRLLFTRRRRARPVSIQEFSPQIEQTA